MPDDISIEDALMTTDMMSTGFHAVENADIHYGFHAVVFGIGPVGLMAVAGAALAGAVAADQLRADQRVTGWRIRVDVHPFF